MSVSAGPFPSNALTIPDNSTRTGLRVHLDPIDEDSCDPLGKASVCSNAALLNQLDGFSVNPRLMACFSGEVAPATLKSGLQIVAADGSGSPIPLNQIVIDNPSHCIYGKPDRVLDQHTSYFFAITTAVKDSANVSVSDSGGFAGCLQSSDDYCLAVKQAVARIAPKLSSPVVSGSLFTTLSATSWLQDVRAAVNKYPGLALPAGLPYSFKLSNLRSLTWQPDNASISSQSIPLSALGGVSKVAFGLFLSPNYLNANGTITTNSTEPVATPTFLGGFNFGFVPVSYHVFIPEGPVPAGGWPVAIFGHGLGDSQFGAATYIASTLASQKIATLALEIPGHGFGPNSKVKVVDKFGFSFTEWTPGRGVASNSGSPIGAQDGCIAGGAIAIRDCGRQAAIDLFALVKTIRQTDGLGIGLNENRIYYVGESFGSIYGSLFHAVEPNVRAAAINVGGGTAVDIARLAITGRPLSELYLGSVSPALFNVASGAAKSEDYFHDGFNDGYVFRDRPPVLNSVPGAIALQAAFEAADWIGMVGDPLAYAPHFKTSPLPGVPAKSTLFQFGLGDLEVPNATETALVRAADGMETSWFLRFDRAVFGLNHPELLSVTTDTEPIFPILPHRILSNPTIFNPMLGAETSIALAEQMQVGKFFQSDGAISADPNTFLKGAFTPESSLFQPLATVPTSLTEQVLFFQIPK